MILLGMKFSGDNAGIICHYVMFNCLIVLFYTQLPGRLQTSPSVVRSVDFVTFATFSISSLIAGRLHMLSLSLRGDQAMSKEFTEP